MGGLRSFLVLAAICTTLLLGVRTPQAQQASGTPKGLVPLAASSLAERPESYFGEYVTVTGAVEQRLSNTVFSIDQDPTKSTGREVLVIAPILTAPVDVNSYVTVIGEVVHVDPGEVTQKAGTYAFDLSADLVEKYKTRPAILATSVLNAAMVDLAKPLPRPMTAEEVTYARLMKRIGPAFSALRQAITASSGDETRQHAAELKAAFLETEAFWKTKKRTDAVQWASEARTHAESIERAAAAANWDDVKTAAGVLGQRCQSCHSAYRERLDDGTYRIRADVK